MTTTQTEPKQHTFIGVTIKMRLGVADDFRKEVPELDANGIMQSVVKPKIGQPYFVKSLATGQFDNRNYQINDDTDWDEFKSWLRQEMVYVPADYFELKKAGEV